MNLFSSRSLILQLIRREIAARYRGSIFGVLWSLFTPLLMLAVYTFVFGTVFQARGWSPADGSTQTASFALALFSGLIPFSLFAEVVGQAPQLVTSNRNYVKKVVFPIEALPVISMGTALLQACISFAVLLVFLLAANGSLPWTVILLPVVMAPFIVLTLGLCWLLAALGVYLRDISQIMPPLLSGTMFLSAIFYPLDALPEKAQILLLYVNPLVFPIEQIRRILIQGVTPQWAGLALYAVISLAIAVAGYWVFQTARRGFADVL